MKDKLFISGVALLFISLFLLFVVLPNGDIPSYSAIKCDNDCHEINMTMKMMDVWGNCVCYDVHKPGIRRYPWSGN